MSVMPFRTFFVEIHLFLRKSATCPAIIVDITNPTYGMAENIPF